MSYPCEAREQPAQRTLTIRTRTPVEKIGAVLERSHGAIAQYLGELGECPAGPPFAAYYNEDMQDLDVEIGFPVAREPPRRSDVQPDQIPGGQVATCLYTGPFSGVAQAYETLAEWMTEHGHETHQVDAGFHIPPEWHLRKINEEEHRWTR